MRSKRLKKTVLVVTMIGSFLGLLPVSFLMVDHFFFTRPYDPHWPCSVLLVWPDHVEVRRVKNVAEVSPRPPGELYTFSVPPERQEWVEKQVRNIHPPNPDAGWAIRIKQLGANRQQIQLEIWPRDGFSGLIYEAHPNEIIPIHTRHAGVGAGIIIFYLNVLLWGAPWLAFRLFWRLRKRPREASGLMIYM